ncbi:putative ribulose bisphosphate carboxylase-like protein [Clarias magur]|uniref:Putative ribulose bisphosphate carboxylase-like protein n=1 Tax=Clarias magur TaxID=1594786 RepID=A0A8J4UGH8_CLAMG|nr:putative ribulose bisphosphate carboxylase-like protein [Clarias magur]
MSTILQPGLIRDQTPLAAARLCVSPDLWGGVRDSLPVVAGAMELCVWRACVCLRVLYTPAALLNHQKD